MTSAHSMLPKAIRRLRLSARMFFLAASASLGACNGQEKLHSPAALSSPYDRPQLWAVAPFVNESGVSLVKTDRVADIFVEQTEEIDGIAAVPVNRVMATMRRLDMRTIATPADAMTLMNVLNVDGLIVGTVTTYDPYPPLKFGAAVQLFRRDAPRPMIVDPVKLTRSTGENEPPMAMSNSAATDLSRLSSAQASGVFDASNHQVLMWLDQYSTGRNEPGSAYGKRIYLASMEMYTQFVAYRLLHDLLGSERARLQPPATQSNQR